jgi:hypothetical protein
LPTPAGTNSYFKKGGAGYASSLHPSLEIFFLKEQHVHASAINNNTDHFTIIGELSCREKLTVTREEIEKSYFNSRKKFYLKRYP